MLAGRRTEGHVNRLGVSDDRDAAVRDKRVQHELAVHALVAACAWDVRAHGVSVQTVATKYAAAHAHRGSSGCTATAVSPSIVSGLRQHKVPHVSTLTVQRARQRGTYRVVATTISPLLSSSWYAKLVMTPNSTVPTMRATCVSARRPALARLRTAALAHPCIPGHAAACCP